MLLRRAVPPTILVHCESFDSIWNEGFRDRVRELCPVAPSRRTDEQPPVSFRCDCVSVRGVLSLIRDNVTALTVPSVLFHCIFVFKRAQLELLDLGVIFFQRDVPVRARVTPLLDDNHLFWSGHSYTFDIF